MYSVLLLFIVTLYNSSGLFSKRKTLAVTVPVVMQSKRLLYRIYASHATDDNMYNVVELDCTIMYSSYTYKCNIIYYICTDLVSGQMSFVCENVFLVLLLQ